MVAVAEGPRPRRCGGARARGRVRPPRRRPSSTPPTPPARVAVVGAAQDLGDRVVVDRGAVELRAVRVERAVDRRLEPHDLLADVGRHLLGQHAVAEHRELARRPRAARRRAPCRSGRTPRRRRARHAARGRSRCAAPRARRRRRCSRPTTPGSPPGRAARAAPSSRRAGPDGRASRSVGVPPGPTDVASVMPGLRAAGRSGAAPRRPARAVVGSPHDDDWRFGALRAAGLEDRARRDRRRRRAVAALPGHRAHRRGARLRLDLGLRPLPQRADAGARGGLRVLDDDGRARAGDHADPARSDGELHVVPAPDAHRQDHQLHRRDLGRPARLGRRRRAGTTRSTAPTATSTRSRRCASG